MTATTFSRVTLDLLKQSAFEMEYVTYRDPWFPSLETYRLIYHSFTEQLFELCGSSSLFASIVEVPPDQRASLCTLGENGTTSEVDLAGVNSGLKWLFEQATTGAEPLGNVLRAWRAQHESGSLYVVPYIVKQNNLVKEARDNKENPRLFHRELLDPDSFLYTRPTLISQDQAPHLPSLHLSYFSAAWLVAVERDHKDVACNLEALSILFQMSWGYPELVATREKAEIKDREIEVQGKTMARLKRAAEVAQKLSDELHPLFETAQHLQLLLTPRPFGLLSTYKLPYQYIPTTDHQTFHNKWDFMHEWTAEKIASAPDAFCAQFSCVLLSYLGEPLPRQAEAWDDQETPWCKLGNRLDDVHRLSDGFSATLAKVGSACERSEHHRTEVSWTNEDARSFFMLKACFHYPFKGDGAKLTGPLLVLWGLERQGKLTDTGTLLGVNPAKGIGWPDCRILIGIHGLAREEGQSPREVALKGICQSNRCNGAEITISGFAGTAISKISEMLEATLDQRAVEEHLADRMGDMETYVTIIRYFGGIIKVDKSGDCVSIMIPVERKDESVL